MTKALIVHPDDSAALEEIDANDLETLKGYVGGWLEAISPSTDAYGDWHAYVNEEGKLQNLPLNRVATILARGAGWLSGDVLVGTAVFLGSGEDGAEGDVPEAFMEVVGMYYEPR